MGNCRKKLGYFLFQYLVTLAVSNEKSLLTEGGGKRERRHGLVKKHTCSSSQKTTADEYTNQPFVLIKGNDNAVILLLMKTEIMTRKLPFLPKEKKIVRYYWHETQPTIVAQRSEAQMTFLAFTTSA